MKGRMPGGGNSLLQIGVTETPRPDHPLVLDDGGRDSGYAQPLPDKVQRLLELGDPAIERANGLSAGARRDNGAQSRQLDQCLDFSWAF